MAFTHDKLAIIRAETGHPQQKANQIRQIKDPRE